MLAGAGQGDAGEAQAQFAALSAFRCGPDGVASEAAVVPMILVP